MSLHQHAIQAVVQRTGLSAHVIRIWEKRYGAVVPERTGTNRRLYSDEQIERLTVLRQLTQAGQSIGTIAQLPLERLRQIAADTLGPVSATVVRPSGVDADPAAALLAAGVAAVRELDTAALGATLRKAELQLGAQGMLQRFAAPLAQTLGELWRDGTITAAHEHFATALLRVHLARGAGEFAARADAPLLVVATPTGQLHELGALLAAAAASNLGWRVVYLGASLPAAEIAGAAVQRQARAVALSLVYPQDDPALAGWLELLRELLPASITLVAGGRAVPAVQPVLERLGARIANDLTAFGALLDALRAER
ncbi:MAG TPA: MerR family transcriptional regulator [Opitutaceae bacterium]|nr:MerR family transcriptional regulator [Opitutaceae bacterium]